MACAAPLAAAASRYTGSSASAGDDGDDDEDADAEEVEAEKDETAEQDTAVEDTDVEDDAQVVTDGEVVVGDERYAARVATCTSCSSVDNSLPLLCVCPFRTASCLGVVDAWKSATDAVAE